MKYRKPHKITQRTSSMTNSFVQAVIPWVEPSRQERAEALAKLDMTEEAMKCVYCDGKATDWDHLRPLVKNKRPTGYISDYKNLVPSCGLCNQSKGASEWKSWIDGPAPNSPKSRGVNTKPRSEKLERFEAWGNVQPKNLAEMVPSELWAEHWENLESLIDSIKKSQSHAAKIQQAIQRYFSDHHSA
ncbi:HNH endonuclease [Roseibium polysiphoniae]|uniref:HNH endonuclease n=1 Tax=Roseibium polysiphoniae TaxID=2571221 RepID=A0ABR9CD44_9HYPH|nr:HNH endonuclease [Roseibium polysiphoniae]MBD8877757.1 HNH endonuclease [Roseibium polysiphoniae]